MKVSKSNKSVVSANKRSVNAPQIQPEGTVVTTKQQVPNNGIIDVCKAIMEILADVRWEYGNPKSERIFKTVQIDDGQFERIVRNGVNMEYELAFPAVFIHFTNTRYLVSQQRIGEGRAELRIRYILNRLNTHDTKDDVHLEGFYVMNRIDQDISEKKTNYDCLNTRCQLVYWDQPNSFDNGLQPWWLTYDVWFRETSIWITRNKIQKYIVTPPFTNHADQDNPEVMNPDGHTNLDHPTLYNDATRFVTSGGFPPSVNPNTPSQNNSEQGGS